MISSLVNRLARRRVQRQLRSGPGIVQTRFFGCDLLVRAHEDVGRNIVLGDFEKQDLQHFLSAARDGDVVFDAGANVGAYCVPVARQCRQARVIAFEPIPLNAALLRASALLNGLDNLEVVQACVSNTTGDIEFSVSEDSAYSSIIDTGRKSEAARLRCRAVTLDAHCAAMGIASPDLIKVDVEGAELCVLRGASRAFADSKSGPRLVMVELYDQNLQAFGTSIGEVVDLMTSRGYRPYVLVEGQRVPFLAEHHNQHYNVFFEKG
jgi:FkbM family methyltransferase